MILNLKKQVLLYVLYVKNYLSVIAIVAIKIHLSIYRDLLNGIL